MEGIRLYNQLLLHPLFQGMSQANLEQVIAQTRFDFKTFGAGEVIAKEYDPCHDILFLLDGSINIACSSDDRSYSIHETADGPWMIPPTNLFGLHQHYTRTFTALTACHILAIDKNEVMHLSDDFVIFRFNLLNILTATSQKKERALWQNVPKSLEERILRFFSERCITPHGTKTIYIKMTNLARELNDSRLDISRALNNMQQRGILSLHRGRIVIEHSL